MGVDIFGQEPKEGGDYFRSNWWFWRPLVAYGYFVAPDLMEGCTHWGSNDGDGLDASGSIALANALNNDAKLAEFKSEHCYQIPEEKREEGWAVLPDASPPVRWRVKSVGKEYPFDEELLREWIAFLRVCGGFEIW